MSGDDFGDKDASSTNFTRFSKTHYTNGIARYTNWGVIRALMEFAKERNVVVQTTWMRGKTYEMSSSRDENTCYRFPAWYVIKP
jgi:hypothetical protein